MGCRIRAAKSDLLRLVVIEGAIVPDPRGQMPGRGAYLHPDPGCLALAERRRAFPRAFRLSGPLDVSMLDEFVRARAEGSARDEQASNHDESRKAGSDCDERPMSTRR
ncbi:MAG TPA: YlxR family protein [Streptosporangiaceae bacterium]